MSTTRHERTPAGRNRTTVESLISVAAALAGIWVIAPMVTRLWSLLAGGTIEMVIAPPAATASELVTAKALVVSASSDAIGDAAYTRLLVATIMEIVAVLALLAVVTVVGRRLRPGATLSPRAMTISASIAMVAGLVGKLAANLERAAGEHGCHQLVERCTDFGGWSGPAGNTFILAGILVALFAALVRSESHARHESEGLV